MSISPCFQTHNNRFHHCHCTENCDSVFPSKECSERSIRQRQGCGAKVQTPRLLELLQHSYMYTVDEYHHETHRYLGTPESDNGYSSIHSATHASTGITPFTFKPVVLCSEELMSLHSSTTPPQSPVELKKVSPTPSTRTMTTVDSCESLPSAFDCIHIPSSPTLSSLFHSEEKGESCSVWIPPRAISVCHFLDTKNITYDQSRNKSPSDVSSTFKKNQLFSTRDEDLTRKSRVKTELCMHYIKRTPCPFGSHCTYAHGEDELQLTKLMDLHRAGLADCETYRTKPCLTWVSTGSCPFGKRCASIHDPRVAGSVQSWLPHTETQGNTIATDINVDALHQKRLETILHDNPFGSLAAPRNDFEYIYSLVCNRRNITGLKAKIKKTEIAEHHKISIATQMRGESDFQFKFRPQHIIFDELCMVLQKRAFRLTQDAAVEISVSALSSHSSKDIVSVREIAFGPDCDPSIRGVGLWFNISDKEVTLCTPQQAKRYRWKSRGTLKQKDQQTVNYNAAFSTFDIRDSFEMIRPIDNDAYDLATLMLVHRSEVIHAERIAKLSERAKALVQLAEEKNYLKASFDKSMQHWKTWEWPVTEGRETVDERTPVPRVDDEYVPFVPEHDQEKTKIASPVTAIWNCFAEMNFEEFDTDDQRFQTEIPSMTSLRRLFVFKSFSADSENKSTTLPQISKSRHKTIDECTESPVVLNATKAWRSLLLHSCSDRLSSNDDWEIVRHHFQASRSRRVLSILQA